MLAATDIDGDVRNELSVAITEVICDLAKTALVFSTLQNVGSQRASVFPPPKRAQVEIQSASVSKCVDTEAPNEILETARVAPTNGTSLSLTG